MFPIRRYQNQDQTGGNCREALTLDLKFQVSWKLVQTLLQVAQQPTGQALPCSDAVSRRDSRPTLLSPVPAVTEGAQSRHPSRCRRDPSSRAACAPTLTNST